MSAPRVSLVLLPVLLLVALPAWPADVAAAAPSDGTFPFAATQEVPCAQPHRRASPFV